MYSLHFISNWSWFIHNYQGSNRGDDRPQGVYDPNQKVTHFSPPKTPKILKSGQLLDKKAHYSGAGDSLTLWNRLLCFCYQIQFSSHINQAWPNYKTLFLKNTKIWKYNWNVWNMGFRVQERIFRYLNFGCHR